VKVRRTRKVGLLGAGYISDLHARSVKARRDLKLVAVCDRSQTRAQAAAMRYGIPQALTTLEELLATDVDVVHVLTPPDQHVEAARRVLQSGRHAFVEKPLGVSAEECRALAELAEQRNVRLSANHNFLFLPSARKLLRHAADGTLGRLDQVTLKWMAPLGILRSGPFDNWVLRDPRNLLFEIGPHLVSFVIALVGRLDELRAYASQPLDLPNGARVYRHWHIYGTRGATAVDMTLSVAAGPTIKTVALRSHAASADCDFERDTYQVFDQKGSNPAIENFIHGADKAAHAFVDACRGILRSAWYTLAKRPAQNPFGASVQASIDAFYDSLDRPQTPLLDARFAVDVIAECEAIAATALGSGERAKPTPAGVIVPRASPRVMVFGGTGFIGRHLVRALAAEGVAVRVATRNAQSAQAALAGTRVDLIQGDLSDARFLDSALRGIEVVYHLAKFEGRTWEEYVQGDVKPTQALAERALEAGVKRLIYTGTIASYYAGSAGDVIDSDSALDEQIERRDFYARSKAACEALLLDLHRKRGLPVVIFRPGIVIGPGSPPAHWGVGMFVTETRVRLWGDGNNPLPFVLVDDVVSALVLARNTPGIEGQTFLLTDEPLLSARDYVHALSRALGVNVRAVPTPIWRYYAAELLKEGLKHAIRHPNRRTPSYRDWRSRSQNARYDSSKTRRVLGWSPSGSRAVVIERGITAPAREWML
jgi:nucleoside-diphosphate-sugar epimerase